MSCGVSIRCGFRPPSNGHDGAVVSLSEFDSKTLLSKLGVGFPPERQFASLSELDRAVDLIEFPAVCKLGGSGIAHKTERGLVAVDLRTPRELVEAATDLFAKARPADGAVHLLVSPMIRGKRELLIGFIRDPTWGPTVMLGSGGILTEALGRTVMAPAPLDIQSARALLERFAKTGGLDPVRGEDTVDPEALAEILVAIGQCTENQEISAAEINPVILAKGRPIPVDALVDIFDAPFPTQADATQPWQPNNEHWKALLDPLGVVVAGASTHAGKFGAVALHNLIIGGFDRNLYGTNHASVRVFGIDTHADLRDVPAGQAELLVACTPADTVPDLIMQCGALGIRAVVVASGGFGELGIEGQQRERALVELANASDVLLIGPNVQGIVSTPSNLVAQIVGPAPKPGPISVVSQSGNIASSLQNLSLDNGIGISRALSLGNAAQIGVIEALEFLATDATTKVSIAYIEGLPQNQDLAGRLANITAAMPLVVIQGGSSAAGARAAATHTGSLASDAALLREMSYEIGFALARDPEAAFDIAMVAAIAPTLRNTRVGILTTVGGWGVLAVDEIAATDLSLAELSEPTMRKLSSVLPERWSRNNPIDLAGGERRDSVVDAIDILASSGDVDALLLLGVGIQSNQANLHREGVLVADDGVQRMIRYHEQQDLRYVKAAHDAMLEHQIPVLVASELSIRLATAPAFSYMSEQSLPCFRTAPRAVRALDGWWRASRGLRS